jgi:midasin
MHTHTHTHMQVEGGGVGNGGFAWSDGVFLQALKEGCWVLLDELNLASQSVLEGLNSCLDHRYVYTFICTYCGRA